MRATAINMVDTRLILVDRVPFGIGIRIIDEDTGRNIGKGGVRMTVDRVTLYCCRSAEAYLHTVLGDEVHRTRAGDGVALYQRIRSRAADGDAVLLVTKDSVVLDGSGSTGR